MGDKLNPDSMDDSALEKAIQDEQSKINSEHTPSEVVEETTPPVEKVEQPVEVKEDGPKVETKEEPKADETPEPEAKPEDTPKEKTDFDDLTEKSTELLENPYRQIEAISDATSWWNEELVLFMHKIMEKAI